VSPIDERVPEAIGPLEDQSKDGAYKAGYPTHGKSQERQYWQPAVNSQGLWAEGHFFHE